MASATLKHLTPQTSLQAGMEDQVRIDLIQRDRWVDYARATDAMNRLERLLATPQRERMPCMVIHGESNIGKTLVVRKFLREHPPVFDAVKGVDKRQIIAMQMPATPDQHRFYSALLFELGAPHAATAGVSALERLARDLLRRIAPRMLIVDEVHHLLAGSYREQRASLNLLKYLANDLKICIVLVGTADAPIALQTDAQMSSRFAPFEITRWRESEEFRRFLAAFERVLPLRKPSDLAQRAIVQYVLGASSGLTGEVARLLTESAELAIRDRTEAIGMGHLEQVARVYA